MDNRVVIAGVVTAVSRTRYTPAGIPINRFTLKHESRQWVAEIERNVKCVVAVVASGQRLAGLIEAVEPGTSLRVSGSLSRSDSRADECRLVLHADRIELL